MQNLSLNDMSEGQHPGMLLPMQMGPPPVAQLPPQMFTTAAQLLDLTDKKLMVALRDGKTLFGILRAWDQFGNLMMQDTLERIYIKNIFADIPRGIFVIRGENVEMIGEIDLDKEDDIPAGYTQEDAETVHAMFMEEDKKKKKREKEKKKALAKYGFEGDLDLAAQ
ncbi:putative small nuclear ribonucleo protein [Venturia nashicola]|uniref:U6 snRNA-associated Sm-like protein LSm1 n=1 Tax=Venturia nashicola TaxID=86259 RepID=A0A4Z1PAD4_9PEZI|nr:putative small nuclear ribonucleo protein [Venturia nashicola]TLD36582.1 putative small nuclear ribonucleo protein [Venturia nashicola]